MNTSMSDSTVCDGLSQPQIHDIEQTLGKQMLLYVYDRSGIVKARQLSFWERFREETSNVTTPAYTLRRMFFCDILAQPEHFDGLDYAVIQYINPSFNQIPAEALCFGDIKDGEDYTLNSYSEGSFEEDGDDFRKLAEFLSTPIDVESSRLPPLQIKSIPQTSLVSFEDLLLKPFCRLLSELVYTEDEKVEKPILEVQEICKRVQSLSENGIVLEDLMTPGMECYQLLNDDDQAVPEATGTPAKDQPALTAPSTSNVKRWRSFDDSGLGQSSSKRRRSIIPSSILAKRKKAAERRTICVPRRRFK